MITPSLFAQIYNLYQRTNSLGRQTIRIQLSIRWKLIIAIIIPLTLVASIVLGLTLRSIYIFGTENIQQQKLSELNLYASRVDAQFQTLAQVAQDTANFLSIQENLSEDEIYAVLMRNVDQSPLIYGSAIAFEPFAFNPDQRLFSPYVYEADNTLAAIEIGADAYDYSDGSWEWFSSARENLHSSWSEPFFDTDAGNILMVTYSAPFFTGTEFRGVATIDVALEDLQTTASNDIGDLVFSIQSASGRYISHSNPSLIMDSSIQEQSALLNNPDYSNIVEAIIQGANGVDMLDDFFLNGEIVKGKTWAFYTAIPTTGWSLTTMIPEASITAELRSLLSLGVYGILLMIVIIFIFIWGISSRITKPIATLAHAVSEVARGKLDTPIENIRAMDEIGKLSIGFNRMVKNLKKQIRIQSEQNVARQIVEKELQMARETQKSLLPTEFPPFPDRDEFELHAVNQAAHHVAGDFFDFFLVNPKTLIFVIADVSGKGMSAALVMAVTRTIIRNLARSGKTPAQILTETNERLIESHKGSAFVTIFLGSYNTSNGKIIYANGGHSSAFRISKNGDISTFGEATGTIVGMLENQEYLNQETRLQPDETILLYTDGMSEARTPSGEFYGESRIQSFLERNAGASPSVLCETAIKEICQFQEHELFDDVTLLALRRSPTKISRLINELMRGRK